MKNKFIKNSLSLFTGTMAGQILIIISSPLLTRIYSLEEFGQLAIFTSILSIFINILSCRYEMAFINIDNNKSKLILMKGIMILILITSSTLILSLIVLDYIDVINYFDQSIVYILLWISLLGLGTYNAISHYAISENKITHLSLSKFQQSGSLVIIQLVSGVFNYKNGLILGDSLSRVSGIIILLKTLKKDDYREIFFSNRKDIFKLFKRYSDYAKFSVISGVSNNFVMQALPIILGIFYIQPLIGLLTIVQRVLVVPIKLVSQSIRQSFMNEMIEHIHNENYKTIKKYIYKITITLSIILILPIIPLLIYGEELFVFALGTNLIGSGSIINALILLSVFQFIFIPITQTLEFIGEQKIYFHWQIMRFITVLIVLLVLPFFDSSFTFVLYFYAIVMALFYILLMIITILRLERKTV